MADGDYTIPTYPGTVSLNGGTHGRHGLEGKDATLIHSLHDSGDKRDLTRDISVEGKDNIRTVLESKFDLAMSGKDTQLLVERGKHETLRDIQDVRKELKEEVRHDGQKTRDLIISEARAAGAVALADAKSQITLLQAKIDILTSGAL